MGPRGRQTRQLDALSSGASQTFAPILAEEPVVANVRRVADNSVDRGSRRRGRRRRSRRSGSAPVGQCSSLVGLVGFALDSDQSIDQIVRAKSGSVRRSTQESAVAAGWFEDPLARRPDGPMRQKTCESGGV